MLDEDLQNRIKENNIDGLQPISDAALTNEWVSHPDLSHRRSKTAFLKCKGKLGAFTPRAN